MAEDAEHVSDARTRASERKPQSEYEPGDALPHSMGKGCGKHWPWFGEPAARAERQRSRCGRADTEPEGAARNGVEGRAWRRWRGSVSTL